MARTPRIATAYREPPGDRTGAAAPPDADAWIGLVPADRVSVVAIELPDLRGARLAQALRWAAEDALAGQAEDQHVVPIGRRTDGRMACAVAARSDMERWCSDAPTLTGLVPDAAALPWREGELVLTADGNSILARWADDGFDRLDAALLDVLLPDLVAQASPERVVWYGDDAPDCTVALDPERRERPARIETLLAPQAADASVDLMYGEFASAAQRQRPRLLWTAALGVLAIALLIGDAALEAFQLDRRAAQLQAEIEAQAAAKFPALTLIPGRERAQLERSLQAGSGAGVGLVGLLGRISPLFGDLGAVVVESITGADDRLDLTLRAPGLPDLEALQRQLESRGLRATVEDVAVEAGGVRARMVVESTADRAPETSS